MTVNDSEPERDDPSVTDDGLLRRVARVAPVDPGPLPLVLGDKLARFRLISELGRGGMGVVYLAEDETLHRQVALKVLASRAVDDERRKLLLREARAAAAVAHVNIASVYELGEAGDTLFIAMERVDGTTLRERLSLGRLDLAEALDVARQILVGLSTAHRAGLVHRDLKPENVMVDREGVVKLLDFGLAKLAPETSDGAEAALSTLEGRRAGTPAYMSPEQVVGDAIGPRSDLFSFGVVLYEMLAGTRPFRGETVSAVMRAVVASEPEPLARARPDLPAALSALVMQCLKKDPEARPVDAPTLSEALAAAARGRPPVARGVLVGFALLLAVVVAGSAGLWAARSAPPPTSSVVSAPSAAGPPSAIAFTRDSIIACPIWEARGVREPGGWLGAAAADLACDMAALRVAVSVQNVVVPAGLLGIPPLPADDVIVEDPFTASDARERSLAAASASTLILDGIVERDPQGFEVTTIVRSPSGGEVGRAAGRGEVISTAIAIAIEGLAADGHLPMVSATLPKDDYPQFTDSPTAALLGTDLYRRVRSSADLADHCRRLLALDGEPLMKRILWPNCGKYAAAGQVRPAFVPDGDSLTTLSFAAVGEGDELSPDARAALRSRIVKARGRELSPAAQATLFDAEARLWALDGDSVRARTCALAALKLLPNDDVAVELVADADAAAERLYATQRWAEAWAPYYLYLDGKTPDERLRQLRRHYELNGAAGPNPGLSLGPALVEQGLIAEARALSADYLAGPPRLRRVADKILSDLAIADGAFGRARDLLDTFLAATPPPSWGYPEVGALNRMLRLSEVLGTSQATADHLLDSFFFQPDKFVYSYPDMSWIWSTLLGTCWRASPDKARRCIELFDKTRAISDFDGTLKGAYNFYVDGVKAYVRGDKHAAVRAWKRVPASNAIYPLFVDVSAFDAIGASVEASAIDVELMKQTTSNYRGATMAHVREARRAAKRGDKQRASELARAVVQAWGGADVPVPAVDEMRALQ